MKRGCVWRKRKKRADWDDGRTIANMNIDGMPWYRPGPDLPGSGEGNPDEGEEGPDGLLKQKEQKEEPPLLQGKPLRRLMVSATLVGGGAGAGVCRRGLPVYPAAAPCLGLKSFLAARGSFWGLWAAFFAPKYSRKSISVFVIECLFRCPYGSDQGFPLDGTKFHPNGPGL